MELVGILMRLDNINLRKVGQLMNLGPFGKLKYLWFLISNWPKFIHCPTFLSSFVVPIFEGASILSLLAFHHCSSTLEKSCSTSIFLNFIYCFIYLISFIMPFLHGSWPNFYLWFMHFSISLNSSIVQFS
jgi:hypothetical protein